MSCVECRGKKVRCSGWTSSGCLRCRRKKVECIAAVDGRRNRVRVSEIEALRRRVSELESEIGRNGVATTPTTTTTTTANGNGETDPALHPKPPVYRQIERLLDMWSGECGECGIFRELGESGRERDRDSTTTTAERLALHRDAALVADLHAFFQWLYPDLAFFLPREPFLVELYHGRRPTPLFCTRGLALAAAALGSVARGDARRGHTLHAAALAELSATPAATPATVAAMQSWLLLALWDLYAGDVHSAWVRVAVAARMATSLPRVDANGDAKGDADANAHAGGAARAAWVFRGRIFWGCFIVERLVAALWGSGGGSNSGSSYTSPTPTERVPDLDWVARDGVFNFARGLVVEVGPPLGAIVALVQLVEARGELGEPRGELGGSRGGPFREWRAGLPAELAWSSDTLREWVHVPPKMVHVCFYYAYRFATAAGGGGEGGCEANIIQDIHDAAELVVEAFLDIHGAARASVLLLCISVAGLDLLLRVEDSASSGANNGATAWRLVRALNECGGAGMRLGSLAAARFEKQVLARFGPAQRRNHRESRGDTQGESQGDTRADTLASLPWPDGPDWADWTDWTHWAHWPGWTETETEWPWGDTTPTQTQFCTNADAHCDSM